MCRIVNHGSGFIVESGFENHTVIFVTWGLMLFEWLSQKTGRKYRLSTETEWDYDARGGIKSEGFVYAGRNNGQEVAWYGDNSDYAVHPVGKKNPNELKIFYISGNVREWCADGYDEEYYTETSDTNPNGPDVG